MLTYKLYRIEFDDEKNLQQIFGISFGKILFATNEFISVLI